MIFRCICPSESESTQWHSATNGHQPPQARASRNGRAGGGPGTAARRLHGGRVRRSPSDPPTLARCGPRAPRPRDLGPRTGSPPRALPLGRSERLLGARPVRWPLRDQVSASSSSASVPMVPGTRTPAAVVSLTPMCRLLLPGFRSSRWAKSASFGSAEATVAHRRPPSPPASPACPPSPPRVGGTPRVRAPVCRAPGPLSLYHLASAQPISPPPMSLWGKHHEGY